MSNYKTINICLASIIGFVFLYTGFFYSEKSGLQCAVKAQTGHECITCGTTRDFHKFTTLDFKTPVINAKSKYFFGFFLFGFISRFFLILYVPSNKKWVLGDILISLSLFLGLVSILYLT